MKLAFAAPAVLAVAVATGCAAPKLSQGGATVKAFVGAAAPDCRNVAEVNGSRADVGGPKDQAGLNRIYNAAAAAGANALTLRSASDEEFKGSAFSCADLSKVKVVNVAAPAKFLNGTPAADCVEVGVVETRVASSQIEVREILTKRAAAMGGNLMKIDTTGVRSTGTITGSGTVYSCP